MVSIMLGGMRHFVTTSTKDVFLFLGFAVCVDEVWGAGVCEGDPMCAGGACTCATLVFAEGTTAVGLTLCLGCTGAATVRSTI